VLRQVVQALVGEFRAFDRVARYGGDEFVVILPNADLRSAAAAGARALERLLELPALDQGRGISASIGAAEWHPPMSTDELIEACDDALLRSKREARSREQGLRAARTSPSRPVAEGGPRADSARLRRVAIRRQENGSETAMSQNSFGAKGTLEVGGRDYEIFRLDALQRALRRGAAAVLAEGAAQRTCCARGNGSVQAKDVEALASWDAAAQPSREIAFTPARVLMQDFTGVPAVVDLAAMRDAIAEMGGDPAKINPLVPAELVMTTPCRSTPSARARPFA